MEPGLADGLHRGDGAAEDFRESSNARFMLPGEHANRNGGHASPQEEEKIKNCIEVDHIGKEEFLIQHCQSVLLLLFL